MKQLTILLLIINLFQLNCFGQDSINNLKQNNTTNQNKTSISDEEKLYKLLYENQIKSNDATLQTIFYALGGLGTAVLLVFGSNWWFNDKKVRDVINEIDNKIIGVKKEAFSEVTEKINTLSTGMKSELNHVQNKLQEEVTANIVNTTLKFTDFTDKIRAEIKDDNKTLTENHQKQIDVFNENSRQQITLFNDTLSSQLSNLKEVMDSKEYMLKEMISSERKNNINQNNLISEKMSKIEFYMWKDSGVFRNAFAALVSELSLKLMRTTTPTSFNLVLTQMSETLDKCTYILPTDKNQALKLLLEIPGNEELKKEILKKIEQINLEVL